MSTEAATTTELVEAKRVNYEPLKPVGSASGLKALLNTMKGSISEALPRHITPERLIKTLLVATNRNPKLLQCTQASILETINRAAELGLDLSGTLGEAYPVPFRNNIGTKEKPVWVDQCQLIIGYRGLEKLAWQSGEVQMIDAEVVCENDTFKFKKGFDPVLEWEPARGDRGRIIGAYALIITKMGGRMARFMTEADIEKVRQGAVSKDSPAWRNHWAEMARKTALRRVLKDAPLSTEKYVKALEHEDADSSLTDVLEVETNLASLRPGRSSFTKPPEVVDTDTGEVDEGDGGTALGEAAKTEVDSATEKANGALLAKREAMKKADAQRARTGCREDLPGCCAEMSQGPDGKMVCANHAFREPGEPSEGPVADKPVRSSAEVKADLQRAKTGCAVGLEGCDSATIKVHKKGTLPRCKNHPEAE